MKNDQLKSSPTDVEDKQVINKIHSRPEMKEYCSPSKRRKLRDQEEKQDIEDSKLDKTIEAMKDNSIKSVTSDEAEKKSNSTSPKFNDFDTLFVYQGNPEITVRMEDYKCLDSCQLITNTDLDFFLQHILNNKLTKQQRERVHIFSSHFYSMYSIDSKFPGWNDEENKELTASQKRYARVQGLPSIANVNIFDKDFLIFPCLDNEHWFLVIVCYPRLDGAVPSDDNRSVIVELMDDPEGKPVKAPMILVFDSLRGNPARGTKAIRFIRNYLESEHQTKYEGQFAFKKSKLVGCHVDSPQQKSGTDCGLFVIEFVEHFLFKAPIEDYRYPIKRSNWFHPKSIEDNKKRKELANIMKSLTHQTILPLLDYEQDDKKEETAVINLDAEQNDDNNNDEKADKNNQGELDETGNVTFAPSGDLCSTKLESQMLPRETENLDPCLKSEPCRDISIASSESDDVITIDED